MPGSFFDTNVILYVASPDEAKAERAKRLVAEGGTVSVQVLNEIVNVARRKMRMSWGEIHTFLEAVRELVAIQPMTVDVHETGLLLAQRHNLSTYDAMIAASALLAGCDTLWSEDMQDGLRLDGRLRIVNPFR